jgi:hypothetical protein
MDIENSCDPILSVHNVGKAEFPYQVIRTQDKRNRYIGFFANEYNEQWIFIYDPELGGGILMGSDVDWHIYPLGNGNIPKPKLILGDDEQWWLMSCWRASSWLRQRDESNENTRRKRHQNVEEIRRVLMAQ